MKKLSILFLTLVLFLAACAQGQENMEEETPNDSENNNTSAEESIQTLKVYTTLFPLEDFTNRIGGEYVEVTNIIPAGADAHSFEPTANQMINIANGDLFIYNGAGFEVFAEKIKEAVASHAVKVVTASEGIELIGYDHDHHHVEEGHSHEEHEHRHEEEHEHGHEEEHEHGHEEEHDHEHEEEHEHGHEEEHDHEHEEESDHGHGEGDHSHSHGEEDPHVWLDPLRAIQLAENIKNALVELRPDEEDIFNTNYELLVEELELLHEEFLTMKEEVTKSTIVVSHAGYGYWDNRYHIHQVGIAGISPTNEPSIKQIQETIAYIEEHNIGYIMFEQNIPTNIAETVRDEVGAEALWLHNLESLTQEEASAGETYFTLMRKNIETLKTALQ